MEGLDQIIVGALLQALHLVLPARARGQDDDRTALPGGAQILDQFHAGFLRQTQIDDGHIERHFTAQIQTFLAVGRHVHGKAFALEPRGQRFAQRCFVFNQQYAHVSSFLYFSVYTLIVRDQARENRPEVRRRQALR